MKGPSRTRPQGRETYLRLAALLRTRLQESERADRVIDRLVTANPKSCRALLDRAAYRRHFRLPGAEVDLAHARELSPDDPDVILELAVSARESSDFSAARKALERGMALAPSDPRFVEALADLELRDGHTGEAIAILRRGLERLPDQGTLLWSLAESLAQEGDTRELPALIEKLRAKSAVAGLVDYLDACLHFNRGEWADSRMLFEPSLPALESRPALKCRTEYLLGQCYGRLGGRPAAIRGVSTLGDARSGVGPGPDCGGVGPCGTR